MNLNVLTYNICHGTNMENQKSLKEQAKYIKDTNVDVALIQELDFYN